MYVNKLSNIFFFRVKRKKNMFDGLFILQRISTLNFFLNAKVFYQNYFSMRNNYER